MNQIERRLPSAGRIRFGEKGPRGEPRKLDVFRFTSSDEAAIREIAALYGGTPEPWTTQAGQWQVKTQAKEIPVILPPNALGDGPTYELWSGGGCIRRCDGEMALIPRSTGEGAELAEVPCVCVAGGKLECKPITRLVVLLPEIKFGGGWRIESTGWNAAQELPGMVEMISSLQDRGLLRATLALEARTSKLGGKTRNFMVPVLRPAVSVDAILSGAGRVAALGSAAAATAPRELGERARQESSPGSPRPGDRATVQARAGMESISDQGGRLSSGKVLGEGAGDRKEPEPSEAEVGGLQTVRTPSPDDLVVDAEIVTEEQVKARRKMHALLRDCKLGTPERHALVKRITNGRVELSNDLDESGLELMVSALQAIKDGHALFDGVDADGMAIVSRK